MCGCMTSLCNLKRWVLGILNSRTTLPEQLIFLLFYRNYFPIIDSNRRGSSSIYTGWTTMDRPIHVGNGLFAYPSHYTRYSWLEFQAVMLKINLK